MKVAGPFFIEVMVKRSKPLEQAGPSTKGRSAFQQRREEKLEGDSCGEVEFWYCSECNVSKVVLHGSALWDFGTHMLLHRVKRMKFPKPFGPRLVWDRDRVGG